MVTYFTEVTLTPFESRGCGHAAGPARSLRLLEFKKESFNQLLFTLWTQRSSGGKSVVNILMGTICLAGLPGLCKLMLI